MKLFGNMFEKKKYLSWDDYQKKMQVMERKKWEHEVLERNRKLIKF